MLQNLSGQIPDTPRLRSYFAEFDSMAESFRTEPLSPLSFQAFRLFRDTGSRVEYEALYFERRKRLDVLFAQILRGKNEYLPDLEDLLWAICDEYTWALPAHVSDIPEEIACKIDLFAAETAFALSEIHYLFHGILAKPVTDRIRYELMRRIVTPYVTTHPHWGKNNWSSVCANGVLAVLFYLDLKDIFRQHQSALERNLQDFLDSYCDDGCCKEGVLYWSYGFGNFVYAASFLREFTDGSIDYFALPKVHAIARFGFSVYFSDNHTIPFSDGPHQQNYNPGLYHFLKHEYPELPLPDKKCEIAFGEDSRYRYADFSRNLFWYDDTLESAPFLPERLDFSQSQWFIRNQNGSHFACKGGNNQEPHNHNDIGSFFFLNHGNYLLDDLGWPEYDAFYFTEKRYTDFICAMSQGHNVPIINGQGQCEGTVKATLLSVDDASVVMDISEAYPIPGLSLIRTLTVTDDGIRISDSISGADSVTERFVTTCPVEILENDVQIKNSRLIPQTASAPRVSSASFIPRMVVRTGWKPKVTAYLIDFSYEGSGTYTFDLHLSEEAPGDGGRQKTPTGKADDQDP